VAVVESVARVPVKSRADTELAGRGCGTSILVVTFSAVWEGIVGADTSGRVADADVVALVRVRADDGL
jgi:hypothetical protein